MAKEGTLVIDGVEHAGIEFVVRALPGSLGPIAGGKVWASQAIIDAARSGTQLLLDGEAIKFIGEEADGTFEFGPV